MLWLRETVSKVLRRIKGSAGCATATGKPPTLENYFESYEKARRDQTIVEVGAFTTFLVIEVAVFAFLQDLPVGVGWILFALKVLFGAYVLTCVVVGGARGIRGLWLDSGLTPSRYFLELGRGFVFLVDAIAIIGWLASPAMHIWNNYWQWIVGVVAVWIIASFAIPERYWKK